MKCIVDSCGSEKVKRDYCNKHYIKWRRHGDPLIGKSRYVPNNFVKFDNRIELELDNGFKTIIDVEDYDLIKPYKWFVHKSRDIGSLYVKTRINSKDVRLHRFIMGVFDSQVEVDHGNHDTFDNRKSNLRICTRQQNQFNRSKQGNNKYKGIYSRSHKWVSQINFNGNIYLGTYETDREAALAYDYASRLLHKDFGCRNFSDETEIPDYIIKSVNGVLNY